MPSPHITPWAHVLKTLSKIPMPVLDVRSVESFHQQRIAYAKNIPFVELVQRRMFELPPRHKPFFVMCGSEQMPYVIRFFATRATPWCIAAFVCPDAPQTSTFYSPRVVETMLHSHENRVTLEESATTSSDATNTAIHPTHGKRFRRQASTDPAFPTVSSSESNNETPTTSQPELDSSHSSHIPDQNAAYLDFLRVLGMCQADETVGIPELYLKDDFPPPQSSPFSNAEPFWSESSGLFPIATGPPSQHVLLFNPCPSLQNMIFSIESDLVSTFHAQQGVESGEDGTEMTKTTNATSVVRPFQFLSHTESTESPFDLVQSCRESSVPNVISLPISQFSSLPFLFEPFKDENDTTTEAPAPASQLDSPQTHHFHALDIGCGHGRDSLWLALRTIDPHLSETVRYPKKRKPSDDIDLDIDGGDKAQISATTITTTTPNLSFRWHVTAVDEVQAMLNSIRLTAQRNKVSTTLTVERSSIKANGSVVHKAIAAVGLSTPRPDCSESPLSTPTQSTTLTEESLLKQDVLTCPWNERTFDLITIVRFLNPALLPFLPKMINLGGFIFYSHFYQGCEHPANVLLPNQLATIFSPENGFEVILDEVEIIGDGRPVNNFIARRVSRAAE